MLFYVSDYGEPGDMDSHFDVFLPTPPTTCPPPVPQFFVHDNGNFVVHDAAP